jgi:hypothetical protein
MAEHWELRCLCDALHVGAQAVNTWWRPTPAAVFGELETDERAEIVFAEIWSPVTALGVEEELRKIIILLDGEEYGKYVSLSGIQATNMAPPKDRIWAGRLLSFGTPHNTNPLLNTTLKYKQNVTVATLCGATIAITQNYRIRLWGYVYKETELPSVFGRMTFPAQVIDRARGRSFVLSKLGPDGLPGIPVNASTWLTLPGGKDQAIPKINPFVRYAYNLLATDGQQGDYQFRLTTGGVTDEQENLYWEFDDKDALIIEGLGIKTAANMARTGLRIDGDYHPKGPTTRTSMFPTTIGVNPLNYGHFAPYAPVAHPYFVAIPRLDKPYLLWKEIGYVVIRDDGVGVVAINAVVVALTGIRLEMRS